MSEAFRLFKVFGMTFLGALVIMQFMGGSAGFGLLVVLIVLGALVWTCRAFVPPQVLV
jgi:hypothetical protein